MGVTEEELAALVRDGFKSIASELAKTAGQTDGRLTVLEKQVNELIIRVSPVLKSFDNGLGVRMALTEDCQQRHDSKLKSIDMKLWAFMVTAVLGLLSALWSIVQNQISG